MTASQHSLKVYLFFIEDDLPVVKSLAERLVWDGVDVHLSEFSAFNQPTEELGDSLYWEEKKKEIHDVDFVLFCLSAQFYERSSAHMEWQFVLDSAANQPRGSISILSLRLEECSVPNPLMQWPSIDLVQMDGYEKMMLAIKFQADMEGIELESHASWKVKFDYPISGTKLDGKQKRKLPLGMIMLILVATSSIIYLVGRFNKTSTNVNVVPVDVLAENATRNVESASTSVAATNEAYALLLAIPRTQTAEYYTAAPLTQTQAHITPTVTITPTITLTPTHTLTVVSRPVQIVDVGDVSMVLVPGGSFTMGNNAVDNARPESLIDLEPFYIDQFEVTNALYQKCVLADACQPPIVMSSQTQLNYYDSPLYANYPVINVDWNMAHAFCEWRGAHLPTEAEWEKAARGTESLSYPWGEVILCPYANYTSAEGACIGDTQPVNRYLASGSAYNVFNLAGNVAEWVESLYLSYPYTLSGDRNNPDASGPRVVRGGSWASQGEELLTYSRVRLDPGSISLHGNDLGFRCARDAN